MSLAETLKSENRAAVWVGWATETQGDFETRKAEKFPDHRECWESAKEASPIPEGPRAVPGRLESLRIWSTVAVSREEGPHMQKWGSKET